MIETINVWNSGFRIIIWLPLNNYKWFDRHSLAKNKKAQKTPKKQKTKKKKKNLYKYVFFPWGIKVHPQVLYVHIALERNEEHVQKSDNEKLTYYWNSFMKDSTRWFCILECRNTNS